MPTTTRPARTHQTLAGICLGMLLAASHLPAASVTEHPFHGVTLVTLRETSPRNFTAHAVIIDLATPGLRFLLTPPGGSRETLRQTTLEFAEQEKAQLAVNAHFFLPFPSAEPDAHLIGLAASEGRVYSEFEVPDQNYALVPKAPAINLDRSNHASLIRPGGSKSELWTTVSGSAQIITNGKATVPTYRDAGHPDGELTPGGPGKTPFSNQDSWYERPNARTAIGIAEADRKLVLLVVDRAAGSQGLTVTEMANLLMGEFHVTEALNLDGGGSSTLVMEDPVTHQRALVNASSDNPKGRSVASNLAVFVPAARP
jgi:Phosphodiester glycosidase